MSGITYKRKGFIMKKRFSVALFIGHMESKFSEEIFLGAAHEAEENGINLVVFPVRFLEEENTSDSLSKKTHYQYSCLFSYAEHSSFDAVILETAVMGRYVNPEVMAAIAARFKGTPFITISEKISSYPCISFETNGIDIEIDHLVKKHGRKRIGFVSGPSSNLEAVQRLERYKASLERNGIPYDPKLVVEGDFTENCGSVVEKLLEDNEGNIDSICFANDLMARAGYDVIRAANLIVGKDIMVTGFDDIPEAITMNPPLTTIRARYRDLGATAVKCAVSSLHGNDVGDIKVATKLIERDSCGCRSNITDRIGRLSDNSSGESSVSEFIKKIDDTIDLYYKNTNKVKNQRMIDRILTFAKKLLLEIKDSENSLNRNLLTFNFEVLLRYGVLECIPMENLSFLLSVFCDEAVALAPNEQVREEVYRIFMDFFRGIIKYENEATHKKEELIKEKVRYANSIIGNTIECFQSSTSIPSSIVHNLSSMGIKSSYLYLHEKPVISKSRNDWVQPGYEMLFAFRNPTRLQSFVKGRRIRSSALFRNEYMPENRFTFIASPLFCGTENYGLLLYDIEADDYNFYNSIITSQLSYAIKLRNELEKQKAVQTDLRESLNQIESRNERLNIISKSDELTGVLNRRGFLEKTKHSIIDNFGLRAAVVFADMDNLKQINDIFGHDEGDYAIRKAAEILSACLPETKIIARFGGDEFAAFLLTDTPDFGLVLRERIRTACEELNSTSGKPYMIRISIGVHEFVCQNDTSLHNVMSSADKLLYETKKYKVRNVLRNPE